MNTKIIAITLLIAISCLMIPHSARAGAWGESIYAAVLKQMLEEMYVKIKETIVANLKIVAVRIIQARLNSIMGMMPGGSMGTSSLVISDWRQFIYGTSQQYSYKMTTDYFQSARTGIPQPLVQRTIEPAEKMVMTDPTKIQPDLHKYVLEGRAENIFKPGASSNPWLAWNMAALDHNNPIFYYNTGEALKNEMFRQKEEEKKTEGQAGLGVEGAKKTIQTNRGPYTAISSTGRPYTVPGTTSSKMNVQVGASEVTKIVTPGSVIKDLITEVQSMPIKMLTLARSIPEIVTNMVTQMITQMIQQGVANINSQIDQQINQFTSQSGLPIGQIQTYIQSGTRFLPQSGTSVFQPYRTTYPNTNRNIPTP